MTLPDFEEFLRRYHAAAKDWMHGNPRPWVEICSHAGDITTFEAWGGWETGWSPISRQYESQSSRTRSGTITFETKQQRVSADLAFVADLVRGRVMTQAASEEVPFELRVTAVFRVEDGHWELVHRHVDPMVKPFGEPP